MRTDNLQSAIDTARHARGDRDAQLVQLLDQMVSRIVQLEARLDQLSDLTVGDGEGPFDARVIAVLEDRDTACRAALSLGWDDIERQVLSTIEENSYSVYTHIEAEIEEKLDSLTQSYGFAEAVEEAVKGSIVQTVEDVIEEQAEDIVRKGLSAII